MFQDPKKVQQVTDPNNPNFGQTIDMDDTSPTFGQVVGGGSTPSAQPPPAPPQSTMGKLLGPSLDAVNPVEWAKGLWQTARHLPTTFNAAADYTKNRVGDALGDFATAGVNAANNLGFKLPGQSVLDTQQPNSREVLPYLYRGLHESASSLPFIGPAIYQGGNAIAQEGDYPKGIGYALSNPVSMATAELPGQALKLAGKLGGNSILAKVAQGPMRATPSELERYDPRTLDYGNTIMRERVIPTRSGDRFMGIPNGVNEAISRIDAQMKKELLQQQGTPLWQAGSPNRVANFARNYVSKTIGLDNLGAGKDTMLAKLDEFVKSHLANSSADPTLIDLLNAKRAEGRFASWNPNADGLDNVWRQGASLGAREELDQLMRGVPNTNPIKAMLAREQSLMNLQKAARRTGGQDSILSALEKSAIVDALVSGSTEGALDRFSLYQILRNPVMSSTVALGVHDFGNMLTNPTFVRALQMNRAAQPDKK